MNAFAGLLAPAPNLEPGDVQSRAYRGFPLCVSQSHLLTRKPCTQIPSTGTYVVIGIASYSPMELQLLDDVNAAHNNWRSNAPIAVFDVLECQTMADFEKYVPGVGSVAQSPIVAVWQDGKLVAKQTGSRMAREVLKDRQILG